MKTEQLFRQLKKQKNSALGLDIGKDSVKLVELARDGETVKLNKIDSAKVPQAAQAALEQKQIIKRVISNLLAKNRIKSKDVILGIKGQSVFIKFLEILPVSAEKLEQTIKYEAQQQIPFSLEEVEWDTHLFGKVGEGKSSAQRLLLVAIKKDRLDAKRTLVEELGLRPSILDVSTLSIYNCVRFNRDYDENNLTCVLDIGAESSDLLILKGNSLWMRSFAIGGDSITAVLQKKFNISFPEAEKLKQRVSIDNPETKEVLGPVLEDLRGEITRSIEYYYFQQGPTQEGEAPERAEASMQMSRIDQIQLSGGAAQLPGLDKFLAQSFSCQLRQLDPFKMVYLAEEIKDKLNSKDKVLFTEAVGLALSGLSKSQININLLKEQRRLKTLAYQKTGFGVGSLILALLILFGAYTFMRQDYREKNLRLQHLKGLLNTFTSYQPRMRELESKEKLLSRQVDLLRNLAEERALWLEVLSELQKMIPDDLWITEVSGTFSFAVSLEENFQSKLDLQGKASSYDGVNDFVSKLKSSAKFYEVTPLSSAFIEEAPQDEEKLEVVKFSISMKVLPKGR